MWCVHARRALAAFGLSMVAGQVLALEGIGYGANEDAARRAAVADLAAAIRVQVKAVVESCTQVAGKKAEDCGSRVMNRAATDLPLLGLQYAAMPGGSEPYGSKARLEPAASAPLYRQQLERLQKDFKALQTSLAGAKTRHERHEILGRQLAAIRQIEDHRLVATALGSRVDDFAVSETAVLAEREKLEDKADSLQFAARLLVRDLKGSLAMLEPLRPANSREATPFGNALGDALRAEMSGRSGTGLRIGGEYRLLDTGDADIALEVREDWTGELLGVRTVRVAKAAFAGYRATPLAPDFERLLTTGEVVSDKLRAELVTSRGAQALRLRSGDNLKLLARVNRAAYIYVVGHVIQPKGQFSYLLPLQEGNNDARFVRWMPADQANHYVEVGEFAVEPPYGTEHLQIFASTENPTNALPPHQLDAASGHYMIRESRGNVMKAMVTTRALARIQPKTIAVAEGTLSFTTTEK
jgi:hypothetical protein